MQSVRCLAFALLIAVASTQAFAQGTMTPSTSVTLLGPRPTAFFIATAPAVASCTQTPTNNAWVFLDPQIENYVALRNTLTLAYTLNKPVVLYLDTCALYGGYYFARVVGVDMPQ